MDCFREELVRKVDKWVFFLRWVVVSKATLSIIVHSSFRIQKPNWVIISFLTEYQKFVFRWSIISFKERVHCGDGLKSPNSLSCYQKRGSITQPPLNSWISQLTALALLAHSFLFHLHSKMINVTTILGLTPVVKQLQLTLSSFDCDAKTQNLEELGTSDYGTIAFSGVEPRNTIHLISTLVYDTCSDLWRYEI